MKLYELKNNILTLLEMLEDPECGVDEEAIKDTLDEMDGQFEAKADDIAKAIRQLKADAEALKIEEQRFRIRKQRCWKGVESLQKYLEESMRATGKTKFKTTEFSYGIQRNPASVVIDHPELVPEAYIVPQEVVVDKNAIKDLLKADDELAKTFAHLEYTEGLRIR